MASIADDIAEFVANIPTYTVEFIAGALAVFTTARQALRTVATVVAQAVAQPAANKAWSENLYVPISPADLADMSIRALTIPTDDGGIDAGLQTEAAFSGISPERLAAMSLNTGEPYGIDQALSLYWNLLNLTDLVPNPDTTTDPGTYTTGASLADKYGITLDELTKVIRYSRVRDEFQPDLLKLPWTTMTKGDAIDSTVKGRLTVDAGKQLFIAAGGMPEQWDALYAASGDSVGVAHAVALEEHGLITADELHKVILQSRINPEFYADALLANRKWLPAYQLEKVAAAGIIDGPTLVTWLVQDGYPTDQAAAFAALATSGKTATVKQETVSMILDEYEAQTITAADATTALRSLGYTAASVPIVLEYVETRRELTMRNAAISRLRTAYVDFLIPESEVRSALTNIGLSSGAVEQFVTYWTLEQATNVKRLTAAQVGTLVKDSVISPAGATTRWTEMGYLPEEAALLLYIYPPGPEPAGGYPVTTVPPSGQNPG